MIWKILSVAIGAFSLIGGLYAWDVTQRDEDHAALDMQSVAGDMELQFQTIELEIDLLQDRRERDGELSPNDQDRLNYLLKLREIIKEKQFEAVS